MGFKIVDDIYDIKDCINSKNPKVYIYGAGYNGKLLYIKINDEIKIESFIETKKNKEKYFDKKVIDINEFKEVVNSENNKDVYVLLGVSKENERKVLEILENNFKGWKVLDNVIIVKRDFWDYFTWEYFYKNRNKIDIKRENSKFYYLITGKKLNLDNPKTFGEKINYLKLFESTKEKGLLSDKYYAKKFVEDQIGEFTSCTGKKDNMKNHIIKNLGVYNSFDEINFEKLPKKFVIKCNHGSGTNYLVEDKNLLKDENIRNKIKKQFDNWMSMDYAYQSFELHYGYIDRKIIIESFIETKDGSDVICFDLFCFNGNPEIIELHFDTKFRSVRRSSVYDKNFNLLRDYKINTSSIAENAQLEKPPFFDDLIMISKKLSKGFAHARIDFLIADENYYFSEITFTDCSGFSKTIPEDFNVTLGNFIDLDKVKRKELK